jgi:hypothetical protein
MDEAPKSQRNNAIALSMDARTLGEFIANLLGQRRRLSRHFNVVFYIDWPWIQNLDQLIVQRVGHQNESSLVDFSFKLFLSSGRTTYVTSRHDFASFRDLSSFETVGVELAWTFIVKFPTAPIPEKQEIRFSARTETLDTQERDEKLKSSFLEVLELSVCPKSS